MAWKNSIKNRPRLTVGIFYVGFDIVKSIV